MKPKKDKRKKKMSRKEVENLMGIHRDTYTRSKGAIRRK